MNEKLRKKLDELDINQVELCKFVGLTKPFLSDLINHPELSANRKDLPYIQSRIAEALECEVDEIF
jgi:predicted transcriptional regulator